MVAMTVKRVAAAVFVKTPGFSPLKTRLAAGLGTAAAEAFHRQATRCLQETLNKVADQITSSEISFTPFWAVAEESALGHPLWSGYQTIPQGTGRLGARMHSVYSRLLKQHDAVVLLGADSPQLPAGLLTQVIESFATSQFVLGPASDGGFFLLGGTGPIPLPLWERVPYSVPETFQHMREELTRLGELTATEPLTDVDVGEDLKSVLPALQTFPEGSSQRDLANWIEVQFELRMKDTEHF